MVDDSLTVRELVRKLLANRGYLADVAVDGMDGWNAVRTGQYDLVITDVDMPRLDGIELATLIKKDPRLKSLPVMIVSYKDREEDRLRGLEAGADYYLTKGSFHDETLLQAVVDLIGEPRGMRIALVNDVMAGRRSDAPRGPQHARTSRWPGSRTTGPRRLSFAPRDTPDLILMDLIMPGMDGVEATRRIMARKPCAIVVVTANVNHQSAKVFEAMGAGALDAVNTPVLERTGACDGRQGAAGAKSKPSAG